MAELGASLGEMHERYPPVRYETWLRRLIWFIVRAPSRFANTGAAGALAAAGGFDLFIQ